MNIKTIILFASFLFGFTHSSFAQLKEIARSAPIDELNVTASYKGIVSGKHGYYMLHLSDASKNILTGNIKKTSYELIHLNKEMKKVKVKLTEIFLDENRTEIEYFTILDHKIHIFVSTTDKANKLKYVHHHQFDPIDLEPIGQPQKVYESSFKGISKHSSRFSVALSPDGSKILFYEENIIKKIQTEFGFFMLNKMGEIEWEGKLQLKKEKENQFQNVLIRKALVDNEGNIFLLKKGYIANSKNFKQPIGHAKMKYALLFLKSKTDDKITIPVPEQDKKITKLDIGFLENNLPFMLGYYSDEKSKYTSGIVRINCPSLTEDAKLDFAFHPFSEETIRLNQVKKRRFKEPTMNGYFIRSVFQNEDKTLTIIGEKLTPKPSLNPRNSTSSNRTELEHESILVSKVSLADGKILWSNKIPKREHQEIEQYVNFCTYRRGTDLIFIYNDHVANMDYAGTGIISSPMTVTWRYKNILRPGAQISMASINSSGTLYTRELQTNSERGSKYFYPFCSFRVSDDEVIIVEKSDKKKVELVRFKLRSK